MVTKLHADFTKALIQLQRIRIARRKFKAAKHPVRSARAVTRMNMKIGFGLRRVHRSERKRASQSLIGDRFASGKRARINAKACLRIRAVLPIRPDASRCAKAVHRKSLRASKAFQQRLATLRQALRTLQTRLCEKLSPGQSPDP